MWAQFTEIRGRLFDIERFAVHDGPGIHTALDTSGDAPAARGAQAVTDITIPWMKNLRSTTNSRMVGIEVTMTPVMIHGMFPPP